VHACCYGARLAGDSAQPVEQDAIIATADGPRASMHRWDGTVRAAAMRSGMRGHVRHKRNFAWVEVAPHGSAATRTVATRYTRCNTDRSRCVRLSRAARQHSPPWYCGTVRYCAVLCSTVQYCAVLRYGAVLCGTVRYCAVLCGTVRRWAVRSHRMSGSSGAIAYCGLRGQRCKGGRAPMCVRYC
jgi:hypothetical protein